MKEETNDRPNTKSVAYIIGTFPDLTTTFINREMLELKSQGANLIIVSIRGRPLFEMGAEVESMARDTKYILPVSWLGFIGANISFVLTRPRIFFSNLFYLLTRKHNSFFARVKTLLHFGEGVLAAKLLQTERVDHIHAHFADRAATVAFVASRLLNIPYSLTAHANDIYVSPSLLFEKIANAQFATTCTGYNKLYLEQQTGCPIELVYHGLDLSAIEPATQSVSQGSRPLILSVGQLKEKKGFEYLIRACYQLRTQGYDFACEIIGEGPERDKLSALIDRLQLQDSVVLRGALPNREVMLRYAQAALFALPCVVAKNEDRDGIPNVLLEAMASRVPVISSNISGIPEIIDDGVTGLLVNSGDTDDLVRAIARILDNPTYGEKLAHNGEEWVRENFDIQDNISRLVELLNV